MCDHTNDPSDATRNKALCHPLIVVALLRWLLLILLVCIHTLISRHLMLMLMTWGPYSLPMNKNWLSMFHTIDMQLLLKAVVREPHVSRVTLVVLTSVRIDPPTD